MALIVKTYILIRYQYHCTVPTLQGLGPIGNSLQYSTKDVWYVKHSREDVVQQQLICSLGICKVEFTVPVQMTNRQTVTTCLRSQLAIGWLLCLRVYRFPASWIGAPFCSSNWIITVTTRRNKDLLARNLPMERAKWCPAGKQQFSLENPAEIKISVSCLLVFCHMNG